jgi:hypothetical protein
MVGLVRDMPCPECGWVALMIFTPYQAAEMGAFEGRVEPGFESDAPPDTPWAEWIAGVDQLLNEMHEQMEP